MKIITSLWLSGIVLCVGEVARAQSYAETALLFSRTMPGGTARIQAMGGAQISLGGDISLAASNPAGLGMYNRSEVALTLGTLATQNTADYFDNRTQTNQSRVNIPSFGLAFSSSKQGAVVSGTFGVSFTRLNDFNSRMVYSGQNSNSSLIDYFIEDATGQPPTQFSFPVPAGVRDNSNSLTRLAYDNYLIGEASILSPPGPDTDYFTDVLSIPLQEEEIQTRGGQNQWSFGYGVNVKDRVFLGGSLGIVSLTYESQKTFREDFVNEPLSFFELRENLDIRGSGVNINFGAIARPVDFIQVGLSLSTPTWYSLSENYNASMFSQWKNFEYLPGLFLNDESSELDPIFTDYSLRSPWRLRVGSSFFIGKSGFVTVDVEQVNFAKAKYSSNTLGVDFSADNEDIRNAYQSTTTIRAGGEFRHEKFRFRAGYFYMPDPYRNEQNGINQKRTGFTGGIGYRSSPVYVDLAAVFSQQSFGYRPYTVNLPTNPLATIGQSGTQVMVTVGYTF